MATFPRSRSQARGTIAIWVHSHPGDKAVPCPQSPRPGRQRATPALFSDRTETGQYGYPVVSLHERNPRSVGVPSHPQHRSRNHPVALRPQHPRLRRPDSGRNQQSHHRRGRCRRNRFRSRRAAGPPRSALVHPHRPGHQQLQDFCEGPSGELHPDLRAGLPAGQGFGVLRVLKDLVAHDAIAPLAALLHVANSLTLRQVENGHSSRGHGPKRAWPASP